MRKNREGERSEDWAQEAFNTEENGTSKGNGKGTTGQTGGKSEAECGALETMQRE